LLEKRLKLHVSFRRFSFIFTQKQRKTILRHQITQKGVGQILLKKYNFCTKQPYLWNLIFRLANTYYNNDMNNTFKNITSLLFTLGFLTLSLPVLIQAQPSKQWDKTYGGSNFDDITTAAKTNDGGFMLIGVTTSPADGQDVTQASRGGADFWIVKIDSLGNKEFDKRYGGSGNDVCHKVIQNTDGYLLIGETNSPISGDKTQDSIGGKHDIWLVQIRPDGTKMWDRTFGGKGDDQAFCATATDDGQGYIIGAHSDSPIGGNKTDDTRGGLDLWVLKIDKNGNKIWDKTFGGTDRDEYPTGLITTQDGNFVIGCGSLSDASGEKTEGLRGPRTRVNKDVWVVKFSKSGEKIWDKTFGGDGLDEFFDIHELSDASIMLGCNSQSEISFDKTAEHYGDYDFWVIKIDVNGNKLWDKTFGGLNADLLVSMDQNKTGYMLLAGQSISNPSGNKEDTLRGNFDFWLVYIDERGNKIWDKNYGGIGNDAAHDMVKFRDGAYLICGGSSSEIGKDKSEKVRGQLNALGVYNNDFWVVKIKCIFDLNLGNDTLVCRATPVTLDATIPNCRNCLYSWNNGATTSSITVRPTQTESFSVQVVAGDACVIKDDVKIVIIPSPNVATYTVVPPRCTDGKDGVIALDSARGGTPPYYLEINGEKFPRQIFIDKRASGTYKVALVDRKGCRLESDIVVANPTPFVLALSPSMEIPFGDSFRLKATSNRPLSTYRWSDNSIRSLDTFVRPFDSQTYTLTATDSLGCSKKATAQVTIRRDNLFFAPQAFSPNNDTVNDVYAIYGGKTVVSIDNMHIYDRWGELIYQTKRIFPITDSPGWDGTFRGQNIAEGIYAFNAEVTLIDGKKFVIRGDLMLMR
jgi:gliding motility-associated-like protein